MYDVSRLEKIHVTVDMSSVTGGLRRNFGAASSVTPCAEISAHDGKKEISAQGGDRNFGARRREFSIYPV